MAKIYTKSALEVNDNLELGMLESGAARFLRSQEEAVKKADGSSSIVGAELIANSAVELADNIKSYVEASRTGKPGLGATLFTYCQTILKHSEKKTVENMSIDYKRIAMASLVTCVDLVLADKEQSKEYIAERIGAALEDESRWTAAQISKGKLFKLKVEDLSKKSSTYKHMRRSLVWQLNKVDEREGTVTFKPWTKMDKKKIGSIVLEMIVSLMSGDLEFDVQFIRSKGRKQTYVKASEALLESAKQLNEAVARTCVEYKPMTVRPKPWTGYESGGYRTIRVPFLKNFDAEDAETRDYSEEMKAATMVQSTAWKIDTWILDVQKELSSSLADVKADDGSTVWYSAAQIDEPSKPMEIREDFDSSDVEKMEILKKYKKDKEKIYDINVARTSKFLSQQRSLKIAQEYRDFPEIFFPVQADFRLRLYSIPGTLNPQASDSIKALLRFSESHKLTEDGLWWLGVNAANYFGYDKTSLQDRYDWAFDRVEDMRGIIADPVAHTNAWADADKPFLFLQAAREFVRAVDAFASGEDFYTSLPVQVDGKCNGLQHFSAIMRDEEVGKLVGLTYNDTEHDIYTYAAEQIMLQLEGRKENLDFNDRVRKSWLEFGIPRKIAKRPVMTSVYSASRYGFVQQIKDELIDIVNKPIGFDDFELAQYLGGVVDENMSSVIGRAADAMNFLKECMKVYVSYYNTEVGMCKGYRWRNPFGTGVEQRYSKQKSVRLTARLGTKRMQIRSSEDTNLAEDRRMINGVCPNFIHSIDAAHMYKTILAAYEHGIESFSMIHDSFGCHANDVDALVGFTKESFVEIHSKDLLQEFKEDMAQKLPPEVALELPELPEKGSLNINDVYDSEFFFC